MILKGQHYSPVTEFKKGFIPWNKGLKGYKAGDKNCNWKGGEVKLCCKYCNKEFYVTPSRKNTAKFCSQKCNTTDMKNKPLWGNWMIGNKWNVGRKGAIKSLETRKKLSIARKGKYKGEEHPNWKGAPYKNKDFFNKWRMQWRHKKGISKKYWGEDRNGVSNTKEYKKLQRQKRKAYMKGGGELPIERIQMVYEDNIKQYGTLTCYLCLTPVPFKKDHLEHKTPLSRGGTNEYSNLAIACQHCNCKKHSKTEAEYKERI